MAKYVLIILISVFALPSMAQEEWKDMLCEDTCKHVHGIDLSHYQGNVAWSTIGENRKMAYVYIKATEGGDNVDNKYAENLRKAKASGLKVGSYHFFRPKTSLQKQFDNFTAQCKAEDQDLIPMIDIETKAGLADSVFRDSLMTFLVMIEEHYRQKPLLYTGANFYDKYLSGGLIDEYKIMIAQYTDYEPTLCDERSITLWQYTGKGSIGGVKGHVDKSRFMGNHGLREIRYKPSPHRRSN